MPAHWSHSSLLKARPVGRLAFAALLIFPVACGSSSERSASEGSGANSVSEETADRKTGEIPTPAQSRPRFPLPAPEPTNTNPVAASATLVKGRANDGTHELLVAVRIAPGWHIFATDEVGGPSASTTIEVELPDGMQQVQSWSVPDPDLDASGAGFVTRVYTGEVHFRCRLKQTANAFAEPAPIRCRLGYQACNQFSCKPFQTLTLTASIEVSGPTQEE